MHEAHDTAQSDASLPDGPVDVVVVGAGVVGCAIADALAPDHDVVVLDKSGVAEGATGRAAGVITPTLFYGDLPEVARHANEFFRAFDGTHGFEFTERRRYDYVVHDEVDTARDRAADLADHGFPVTYLDTDVVESEAPRLNLDDFAGAVRYDDAGWVDPYTLATALKRRATDRGASFYLDQQVDAVSSNTAELADGEIRAHTVVVAAGFSTPDLLGRPLPIQPYRTQCVVLEPTEVLDDQFPIGRVGSKHLYFRPEHNGDLLVGGSHDIVSDPAGVSTQADESFVKEVALTIPELVRGFGDAGLVNGWAGVDSATPDARPILDQVDDVFVAAGFNGLGILAAPIAAEAIRSQVTAETAAFDVSPFSFDRFSDSTSGFELRTTSDVGR
ncbi:MULTISPECIES: FAD-binding oxidoreductase [Haloferax]|uniref:FAD-dependent oxidoreductase n=1 Tax=Haloferax marinum TaxID=2666143 RepID=A0A6A8GEM4_9EURY|nr:MULTISPECIES: FAD-dependent oxidoreductase [Haloferax]KAB1190705.1 FAD-binding oxidoreductase [Haloferax sp. CBA1150]MRW98236.1 FAD-dependent oxidoreductase [Haloferax marinum]